MDFYYYNGAGQCFPLPERPLEPPDCWGKGRKRAGGRTNPQSALRLTAPLAQGSLSCGTRGGAKQG